MSYVVMARKYRPQVLDEVMAQEHIVRTLTNAFREERIAQSFLFVGSRGVGKTSTARIVAKILNCKNRKKGTAIPCNKCDSCIEITQGTSFDVLEIDGASNRGIDEIRNLRENVKFKPSTGTYKVYIIDEVHMLTQEAFNALLKTLEEPPAHVKFIFATTEAHRVLPTIVSRCQRYDFRRIPTITIVETLKTVARKEKISIEKEALFLIAKAAEGSMRDGESMLDQVASYSGKKVSLEEVEQILGCTNEHTYYALAEAIQTRKGADALTLVQEIVAEGKDLRQFTKGLTEYFRDILVAQSVSDAGNLIERIPESIAEVKELSTRFSLEELLFCMSVLQNLNNNLKYSTFPQITVEVALVKMVNRADMVAISEILASLDNSPTKESQTATHSPARKENPTHNAYQQPHTNNIANKMNAYLHKQKVEHSPEKEEEKGSTAVEVLDCSFDDVESRWTDVLNAVKKIKMSTGIFLADAEPIELVQNTVTVGLPSEFNFHKETLESQDNLTLIEDVIKNVIGVPLKVNFVITERDGIDDEVIEEEPTDEPAEIIESALEIFEGRTVRRK